jgi:hypothetical protein
VIRFLDRISRGMGVVGLLMMAGCSVAQGSEVYFGVADQWDDLISNPGEWKFVRANADGFYVNFIELNWDKPARLKATADLFAHKNGYLESDMGTGPDPIGKNGETGDQTDQRLITIMHDAGFKITYTSLNYGWSRERADNLANYQLKGEPVRLCFVQSGPWDMDGQFGFGNPERKTQFESADGISTDGPIGFWVIDHNKMRENALMLVKYAHDQGKKAVIMISPYGAGVSGYQPSQFLQAGSDEVRYFEDAGVLPDVWSIFEYATTIPAVPEETNGQAVNTSSGMAYWLLKHLHDPDHFAELTADNDHPTSVMGGFRTFNYTLTNQSTWLDLAPILRLVVKGKASLVQVRLLLDGQDVTRAAVGVKGIAFVGKLRLNPGNTHRLRVAVNAPRDNWVQLQLAPNVAQPKEIDQAADLK